MPGSLGGRSGFLASAGTLETVLAFEMAFEVGLSRPRRVCWKSFAGSEERTLYQESKELEVRVCQLGCVLVEGARGSGSERCVRTV